MCRPTPVRSSGTWATPALDRVAGRPVGHLVAVDVIAAAARAQPRDDLGQLALAVARDRGDPDDLARPDLERHAAQGRAGRGRSRRSRR